MQTVGCFSCRRDRCFVFFISYCAVQISNFPCATFKVSFSIHEGCQRDRNSITEPAMYIEVSVAVNYVISYLYNKLPRRRVDMFGGELDKFLKMQFQGHWHIDEPLKGASHRCVRVSGDHTDNVMYESARECGLDIQEIFTYLPEELTLWVDPGEVSYRIGDKGQVKMLYSESSKENQDCLSEATPEDMEQLVVNGNQVSNGLSPDAAYKTMAETLNATFGQMALSPSSAQSPQHPSWSASPSPTNVPGYGNMTVPVPPINSYLQKSSSTPNFTAASFAQTKFGSTKLKTQSKRPSRLSPSEMGAYVKQRQHIPFPNSAVNRSISLSPSTPAPPGLEIPLFIPPNRASPIMNNSEPFPGYLSIQIPPMDCNGSATSSGMGSAGSGNGSGPVRSQSQQASSEPNGSRSSKDSASSPATGPGNTKHENFNAAAGFSQYLLVAN